MRVMISAKSIFLEASSASAVLRMMSMYWAMIPSPCCRGAARCVLLPRRRTRSAQIDSGREDSSSECIGARSGRRRALLGELGRPALLLLEVLVVGAVGEVALVGDAPDLERAARPERALLRPLDGLVERGDLDRPVAV